MTRLTTRLEIASKIIRQFSKKYDSSVLGELGRGAGKGGGGGGPIRDAGGPFGTSDEGKIGAAREEEYYYKLQKRLLADLKIKLHQENNLREQEIKTHQQAIEENNKLAKDLEEELDDSKNDSTCQ